MTDEEIIKELNDIIGMRTICKRFPKIKTDFLVGILDLINKKDVENKTLEEQVENLKMQNKILENQVELQVKEIERLENEVKNR